jgi:hypothetical protein
MVGHLNYRLGKLYHCPVDIFSTREVRLTNLLFTNATERRIKASFSKFSFSVSRSGYDL